MEFKFEFEEREQYTLEDVKAIVSDFEAKAVKTISAKDKTITGLNAELEGLTELKASNHKLAITNLMLQNGLDDDLFDLVADDDLEVVATKIDKLKSITSQKDIGNGYKPEGKKQESQYQKAISDKDVEGALRHKLGRLFG